MKALAAKHLQSSPINWSKIGLPLISGPTLVRGVAAFVFLLSIVLGPLAVASVGAASSSPQNAGVKAYPIVNAAPPLKVAFDKNSSSDVESVTPANLEVVLNTDNTVQVTVDYAVSGGNASGSGADYTLASGTLTFAIGDTSEIIAITVVDDYGGSGYSYNKGARLRESPAGMSDATSLDDMASARSGKPWLVFASLNPWPGVR